MFYFIFLLNWFVLLLFSLPLFYFFIVLINILICFTYIQSRPLILPSFSLCRWAFLQPKFSVTTKCRLWDGASWYSGLAGPVRRKQVVRFRLVPQPSQPPPPQPPQSRPVLRPASLIHPLIPPSGDEASFGNRHVTVTPEAPHHRWRDDNKPTPTTATFLRVQNVTANSMRWFGAGLFAETGFSLTKNTQNSSTHT